MESDNNSPQKLYRDEGKNSKCPFPDKPWYACQEYCGYQCIVIAASINNIPKTKEVSDAFNGWNLS